MLTQHRKPNKNLISQFFTSPFNFYLPSENPLGLWFISTHSIPPKVIKQFSPSQKFISIVKSNKFFYFSKLIVFVYDFFFAIFRLVFVFVLYQDCFSGFVLPGPIWNSFPFTNWVEIVNSSREKSKAISLWDSPKFRIPKLFLLLRRLSCSKQNQCCDFTEGTRSDRQIIFRVTHLRFFHSAFEQGESHLFRYRFFLCDNITNSRFYLSPSIFELKHTVKSHGDEYLKFLWAFFYWNEGKLHSCFEKFLPDFLPSSSFFVRKKGSRRKVSNAKKARIWTHPQMVITMKETKFDLYF